MKKPHVYLTYNARTAWRKRRGYADYRELSSEVAARIMHQIKVGLSLDEDNRAKVRVRGNMIATIQMSPEGWKVLDFTKDTGGRGYDKLEKYGGVS
ncbi:MAG: hypothetical protein ACRDDX_10450 [Cellulosilyticaceae bacterium]